MIWYKLFVCWKGLRLIEMAGDRNRMVDWQIARRGVSDTDVLDAMRDELDPIGGTTEAWI